MAERRRYGIANLREAMRVIAHFNAMDLTTLDLHDEDGRPIPVTHEVLEEWRFIGMNNVGFVELEFWKEENRPKPDKPVERYLDDS